MRIALAALLLFSGNATAQPHTNAIDVQLVKRMENPRTDGLGGNNSYLLEGMPEGAPQFCASFATSYADCTEGFFDRDLNLIASWREPYADGDMVMSASTGDLDNDGVREILLITRSLASDAHALRWNEETRTIETLWSFLDTPTQATEAYFRGAAIGNFTPHPGREVCFGGDGTGLYLLDQHGQLIAHDKSIRKTIQRIDICDNDNDGYDELIIATGRHPGGVYYTRWSGQSPKLETIWAADVTPNGRGGNNCYEAIYHPNGHPDGGPAIAVNTEMETPRAKRTGSILVLDMNGRELWNYQYTKEEERGGACDFADVTGDGVPEILSRYTRELSEPRDHGLIVVNNRGQRIARIPNVTTGSAGPYVYLPNGPETIPIYLIAGIHVYEITPQSEQNP